MSLVWNGIGGCGVCIMERNGHQEEDEHRHVAFASWAVIML